MDDLVSVFVDESTFRFCPPQQICQVVAVDAHQFFVNEEVDHGIRHLDCAGWVADQLECGGLICHRITNLQDIRLINDLAKRCGVCRGEASSYVAAKRENGIVVAQDPRTHAMLKSHVRGVTTLSPQDFIRSNTGTLLPAGAVAR